MKTFLTATLALTFLAPAAFAKPNYAGELKCALNILPALRKLKDSRGIVAYEIQKVGKDGVMLYATTANAVYAISTPIKLSELDHSLKNKHYFFSVKLPRREAHYVSVNIWWGDELRIDTVDTEPFMPLDRFENPSRVRTTNLSLGRTFVSEPLLEKVRMMSAHVRDKRRPFGASADYSIENTAPSFWEEFLKEYCNHVSSAELAHAIEVTLSEIAATRKFLAERAKEKCNEQKAAKSMPGVGGGSLGGDAGAPVCDNLEQGGMSK